jgi:hypothetical protein
MSPPGVGLTGAHRWLSKSCSFTRSLDITWQPVITLLIFIITTICAILDLAFFDDYRLVQESASDFWPLISMSSPDKDPQHSPAPESAVKLGVTFKSSLLPWPENRKSDTGSVSEWERFPHPKELEYLPDDLQTSYELRQIVKRSLYKHEPESSNSRQIEPQVERHESQSNPDPKPLQAGPEKQRRESFGSARSFATCNGTNETRSTAPEKDPPPVPSPPIIPTPKPRELKPKSSFLASKMDRLGAKIEKLEFMSSKRSSRNLEEKKTVVTA